MSPSGTILRLGQTLGPVIIGAVYTGMGMDATFIAGAAVAVVMSLIVLGMIPKQRHKESHEL